MEDERPFRGGTSLPLLSTPIQHPAAEPAAYMTHTCAKSEQIWVVTTQSRQAGNPRQAAPGAGRCRRGRSALHSAGFTSPNSHARGACRGADGTSVSACGPASAKAPVPKLQLAGGVLQHRCVPGLSSLHGSQTSRVGVGSVDFYKSLPSPAWWPGWRAAPETRTRRKAGGPRFGRVQGTCPCSS